MKQVIYIANTKSENIEVWNLFKNGEMEKIQTTSTPGQPQPMNIIKSKNLLYCGVRFDNKIIVYRIKRNGMIEKMNESSIPGSPNYISFDKNKKFLFCSSYHGNCISVSPLNKDFIPQNPIQIIHNIKGCHAAKINYKYNVLFVMSLKEDSIYSYYLTSFGILRSTEQTLLKTEENSGPRHIVFHPNQNFIYTINELNGTVDVWEIYSLKNKTYVKKIQNINISKRINSSEIYWSSDIHITSCGRFLYVSDRMFNTISLFHINKNYTIDLFKNYKTEECPRSFCITFNNLYLIVCGEKSNKFVIYSILEKTGELKKMQTYDTGKSPIWILSHELN